ncbi:MAG TPA: thiamine phosphate synthase, partial [Terriglobales bacterium]|nr:thiamine phosphate synthase [Terriglobales bacterium]
ALLNKIAEAAACGVDYIQLREKDLPTRELESLAHAAVRAVQQTPEARRGHSRTRLFINSRVDVAIACRADGVHLRSEDISPKDVRRVWSARRRDLPVIGVSCHTVTDVARAAAEGADFAVFAPVFEKKDVPDAPAGLSALRQACQQNIPVLALGGVSLENARSCIEAGATGVAGIRLFQGGNLREVARLLQTGTTEDTEDHRGNHSN